jgi:hypothetical protein
LAIQSGEVWEPTTGRLEQVPSDELTVRAPSRGQEELSIVTLRRVRNERRGFVVGRQRSVSRPRVARTRFNYLPYLVRCKILRFLAESKRILVR